MRTNKVNNGVWWLNSTFSDRRPNTPTHTHTHPSKSIKWVGQLNWTNLQSWRCKNVFDHFFYTPSPLPFNSWTLSSDQFYCWIGLYIREKLCTFNAGQKVILVFSPCNFGSEDTLELWPNIEDKYEFFDLIFHIPSTLHKFIIWSKISGLKYSNWRTEGIQRYSDHCPVWEKNWYREPYSWLFMCDIHRRKYTVKNVGN